MQEPFDMRLGDYRETLADVTASLILTSPPYNLGSARGCVRNDKGRRGGKYASRSYGGVRGYDDDLPEYVYQAQQAKFLIWGADHLNDGGTLVYNHKIRRRAGRRITPDEWILRPEVRARIVVSDEIIWDRGSTPNCGPHQIWQQTERLYVMHRADDPAWRMDNHRSRGLCFQSDVWRIRPVPFVTPDHCAPFPYELAEAAIRMWSEPGDLVCDPYAGSGTTGRAALDLGRNFVGSEIDPEYHGLAVATLSERKVA